MKLSSLISQDMVLQSDVENLIWGSEVSPLKSVEISIIKDNLVIYDCKCISDENGYFEIMLPPLSAGGPYTMTIFNEDERITIDRVFAGHVFLLAGQSNMELPLSRCMDLYEEEINEMDLPDIHMFEVPKKYCFGKTVQDIYDGKWTAAYNANIKAMSALGIFFAKRYQSEKNVVVGLIQTAVGGTHIEAYISEKGIYEVGKLLRGIAASKGEDISKCNCSNNDSCKVCYERQLYKLKDNTYIEKTGRDELQKQQHWFEELDEMDEGLKGHWEKTDFCSENITKGELSVPGLWEELSENKELETLRGSVWIQRKVMIPPEYAEKGARLYLGTIIDSDTTYVNGICVGRTDYRYPPRRYKIPTGVLKEGMNTITIRVTAYNRRGGFVPEMPYYLRFEDDTIVPLQGRWLYKVGADKYGKTDKMGNKYEPEAADITFFNWKPTALYNQMIYPLRNWNIKGLLFYQGENNVSHPWEYEFLLEKMVQEFRRLFGDTFLVAIIQLPFFGGEDQFRGTTTWEDIRMSQKRAQEKIDNSVLIDIYDLGFEYELHPQNKKEVADRVYECMAKLY